MSSYTHSFEIRVSLCLISVQYQYITPTKSQRLMHDCRHALRFSSGLKPACIHRRSLSSAIYYYHFEYFTSLPSLDMKKFCIITVQPFFSLDFLSSLSAICMTFSVLTRKKFCMIGIQLLQVISIVF